MSRQQGLPFKPPADRGRSVLAARERWDASNLQSARLILLDPDSFGGEEAGAVRWARAFMNRWTDDQQRDAQRKVVLRGRAA